MIERIAVLKQVAHSAKMLLYVFYISCEKKIDSGRVERIQFLGMAYFIVMTSSNSVFVSVNARAQVVTHRTSSGLYHETYPGCGKNYGYAENLATKRKTLCFRNRMLGIWMIIKSSEYS
jgi:hypothetical protein